MRRSAQAKGTKGAKRLLKRLSGREKRHQRAINHVISRRIVDKAKTTGRAIALEDLTGIRERTKVRKAQRYRQQSWSFFQLRSFIAYKAMDAGVPVIFVDPATPARPAISAVSLVIGRLALFLYNVRNFDADINAALNIAARGAEVTGPEIGGNLFPTEKASRL